MSDSLADVRARFEVAAWQRRIKPDSGKWLAWEYFAGAVDYDNDRARFPDRVGRWECEYRPLYTLADMAGEVRELAEEVIEAINDGDAQSARNAAQAALDKYAHQEKP